MQKYSFDEWTKRFNPITRSTSDITLSIPFPFRAFIFAISEIDDVRCVAKAPPESVWTLINNPDVGGWQIVNGVDTSTQLGYLITTHPHADEDIEVVIMPSMAI